MKLLHSAKSNSFFGQSLFIFLIRFFPVLASVLVTIYYARNLNLALNSKYVNFWIQLPLLTAIACAGLSAFLLTYTPPVIVGLFRKIKPGHFVLYALWLAAAAFMFAAMQRYSGLAGFAVSFLFLIVYSLSAITESFLTACRKFKDIAVINVVYALVFCFLHWYALSYNMSFQHLFTCLLFLAAARLFLYISISIKSINAVVVEEHENISLDDSRSLWLHMMFYDISQFAFKWIDKILISLILTGASAIYFIGSNDIPFLPLILGAAGSASLLHLAANSDDNKYSVDLMQHSARILSAIVFPVFFFLLFFRYEIFEIVYTHKYDASVPIFFAALLVLPLRAYNFTSILQNRHKGRIINIGAVLDLALACVLMYPFYLLWGLPGVAFAFTFTSYLQAGYYLYQTAKVLKVPVLQLIPYRNWLLKLIVFSLFFIAIHYVLALYLSSKFVLILGCVLAAVTALVTLRMELNKHNSNGGTSQAK